MADFLSIGMIKPQEGEKMKPMNGGDIIKLIQKEYPSVKSDHSTKVHLGFAMKELGFEHTYRGNIVHYRVVPLKVA